MLILAAALKAMLSAAGASLVVWLSVIVVRKNRKFVFPVFAAYIIAVLYVTLFSRVVADEGQGINLIPFHFAYWIIRYATGPAYLGVFNPILGVYLNILLFVPFGYLIKVIKPATKTWKIVLAGFGFSIGIECIQLIAKLGMFETDDLMTNTVGTYIGSRIARRYSFE
jgi:glycopeptide antibiotics resistance protein